MWLFAFFFICQKKLILFAGFGSRWQQGLQLFIFSLLMMWPETNGKAVLAHEHHQCISNECCISPQQESAPHQQSLHQQQAVGQQQSLHPKQVVGSAYLVALVLHLQLEHGVIRNWQWRVSGRCTVALGGGLGHLACQDHASPAAHYQDWQHSALATALATALYQQSGSSAQAKKSTMIHLL